MRDDNRIDSDCNDLGPDDFDKVGFKFNFQITNGHSRRACSIRVDAISFHVASAVFRQNWPMIELMARESLASVHDDGEIVLTMPVDAAREAIKAARD